MAKQKMKTEHERITILEEEMGQVLTELSSLSFNQEEIKRSLLMIQRRISSPPTTFQIGGFFSPLYSYPLFLQDNAGDTNEEPKQDPPQSVTNTDGNGVTMTATGPILNRRTKNYYYRITVQLPPNTNDTTYAFDPEYGITATIICRVRKIDQTVSNTETHEEGRVATGGQVGTQRDSEAVGARPTRRYRPTLTMESENMIQDCSDMDVAGIDSIERRIIFRVRFVCATRDLAPVERFADIELPF